MNPRLSYWTVPVLCQMSKLPVAKLEPTDKLHKARSEAFGWRAITMIFKNYLICIEPFPGPIAKHFVL